MGRAESGHQLRSAMNFSMSIALDLPTDRMIELATFSSTTLFHLEKLLSVTEFSNAARTASRPAFKSTARDD